VPGAFVAPTVDQQISDATAAVNNALGPVQTEIFRISPFVSRMSDMETKLGALTDCPFKKLDSPGFDIDPVSPNVTMVVGGTYSLQVTGAIGNVTGQVIGNGDTGGLTSATTGSGTGLRLTITANKVGIYDFSITDASGKNSKVLHVTVTAKKMIIAPADKEIAMKVGDKKEFAVTGVDSIAFPSFTGDAAGLSVEQTATAASQKVTVTAKKAGTYVLTIADGTKQQTSDIKITVTP
jgi:hypothetical protein